MMQFGSQSIAIMYCLNITSQESSLNSQGIFSYILGNLTFPELSGNVTFPEMSGNVQFRLLATTCVTTAPPHV